METEVWKDIPGWEKLYQVSNLGRVKSLGFTFPNLLTKTMSKKKGRVLRPWLEAGYPRVALVRKGKHKFIAVHQLVALAFISNYQNKPHINHKDGNPLNNIPENLEWCTPKENVHHAKNVLKRIGGQFKPVIDTRSGEIYPSIKVAHKALGLRKSVGTTRLMVRGVVKNKTTLKLLQ